MSNLILKKTTNAIFLAIVLIVGTFAVISPSSFIIKGVNAQSETYNYGMNDDRYSNYKQNYGMDNSFDKRSYDDRYGKNSYSNSYEPDYRNDNRYDSYEPEYTDKTHNGYKRDHYGTSNDYDKKSYGYEAEYPSYGKDDKRDKSKKDDSSKVEINKIKCINTNLNINGNNAGNVSIGNKKGQGYSDAYSYGDGNGEGYNGYYEGYEKKGKGLDDCVINNNNNNTNIITGGGNQTIPSKSTLNITKVVTCEDTSVNGAVNRCAALEQLITEDQFLIEVTDDNPVPSSFNGSEAGTVVTLGAGNYIVTETPDPSVQADIITLLQQFNQGGGTFAIGTAQSLTGDCTQVLLGGQATGTIGEGELQTCNIENSFTISRQMS